MTTVTSVSRTQASPAGSAPLPKSREVRAGLVLYGGVSLAVYIHGVTYEFFRAVRGRGFYRLLKALTDSDIVVDVISGTSAGGINGIMLAYALCNDRDFRSVADLWREDGDIRKLLRDPNARRPTSLLDSEGYYQARLQRAFERMPDYKPEPGEDASVWSEMDVFITGTDIHGTWSTQFDDAGHPIDIKDHRAVFHLKHRAGRKCPFVRGPLTHEALAKLSRVTSCFPGAFAPVHVRNVPADANSADGLLQLWGALRREAFFLDGGVVDNKPFTYTLEAIFSRAADRAVDRKLFYVDPDPEHSKATDRSECPNMLQTVLASLIGIPGYEGIADDLKLLEHRNRELKQYKRMVKDLESTWAGLALPLEEESPVAGPALKESGLPSTEQSTCLYRRSRLVYLSERVIHGIFRDYSPQNGGGAPAREKAAKLIQHFDSIEFNPDELLRRIDVHFRRRRLYRLAYRIYERLYGSEGATLTTADIERYQALWRVINRQIELLDIVRWALEGLVDEAPIDWKNLEIKDVWPLVQCACYYLVDERAAPANVVAEDNPLLGEEALGRWLSSAQLTRLHQAFADRVQELVRQIGDKTFDLGAAFDSFSFVPRLDRYERAVLRHFLPADDPVCRAYLTFGALDELLFPLEMVGSLHEKDLIETVRISPRDAQRGFSESGYSDKVSGDALYHFGAFFKRSWRSNDILWGRLDGVCQITETLLTRERLEALASSGAWRQSLRAKLYGVGGDPSTRTAALDPAVLFPSAGEATQGRLRTWLDELASDDRWSGALGRTDTELTALVEAAQLEVVHEELPRIAADAIGEQADWNQYQLRDRSTGSGADAEPLAGRSASKGHDPPWIFRPIRGRLDPFVAVMASEDRARAFLKDLAAPGQSAIQPRDTMLGRFFQSSYKVGSESLTRDIPAIVLLEILATALLVTRNCVLDLFGSQADRVRRSPFYFAFVTMPLKGFYWMTVTIRRSPAGFAAVLLGVFAVCVLALAAAFFFWGSLIRPNGLWQRSAVLWFIAAPIALLVVEFLILSWTARAAHAARGKRSS